jgi:UDPglucose 6-dehydrogenase
MTNIGIVGTGRLGLCLALCLDEAGYAVYCYDTNSEYLQYLQNKTLKTYEPMVSEMLAKSNLHICQNDKDVIQKCDTIFVLVQTPSTKEGTYDHSYINKFITQCIEYGKQEVCKTLVISSTVMPEYTDSIAISLNELNYKVCYNPMFIAQGSIIHDLKNPPLILIGSDFDATALCLKKIHRSFATSANIHKMSRTEAEICKIAINCFITAKISYANMIGDLLHKKGFEPSSVLNAIGSDSRIGNKCLKYGHGFGGPCFPRDNRALYHYADSQGFAFELCKTTDNMNATHLLYQYHDMKNKNEQVVFTYITYKDDSDILEESQKLRLACMLAEDGCKVVIKERDHVINKLKELYKDMFEYVLIHT